MTEYGIVVSQGKSRLRTALPGLLEDAENGLTCQARACLSSLLDEWQQVDQRIAHCDGQIKQQAAQHEQVQRLTAIRGIAEQTATAVFAYVGDANSYKNGRHFSASLGLVPKEHSSGGKQRFGRITKRGNQYIRTLLTQCAWSIISHIGNANDKLSLRAEKVIDRRGKHITAIAIANKLARTIWSMLYYKTCYRSV